MLWQIPKHIRGSIGRQGLYDYHHFLYPFPLKNPAVLRWELLWLCWKSFPNGKNWKTLLSGGWMRSNNWKREKCVLPQLAIWSSFLSIIIKIGCIKTGVLKKQIICETLDWGSEELLKINWVFLWLWFYVTLRSPGF